MQQTQIQTSINSLRSLYKQFQSFIPRKQKEIFILHNLNLKIALKLYFLLKKVFKEIFKELYV